MSSFTPCCTSTPVNPDIGIHLPHNILRLNCSSDPVLLKNVEDVMTLSFAGTTTTPPSGLNAWCFSTEGNIDNDFSQPLLEPPTVGRIEHSRFIIKFSMAISLKHNSLFVLVREDDYESPKCQILAAICCIPPNNQKLHDPTICEKINMFSRMNIDISPIESMGPRKDALGKAFNKSHKKWAHDLHWYVYTFAVNHNIQGKGYGRELLDFVCKISDKANLNLYLETHGPKNRRFYERNGFEVKEEIRIEARGSKPLEMHGGGLAMLRTPMIRKEK